MPQRHTHLILQAIGPEAALLRLHPDGNRRRGYRVEVLGAFRAAARSRDAAAISDDAALRQLAQCVREQGLTGRTATLLLGGASVSCHRLALPKLDRESANKAIRLKLANLLPYDVRLAALAIEGPTPRETEGTIEHVYQVACAPAELPRTACQAVQTAGLVVHDLLPAAAAIEAVVAARLADRDTEPIAAAYIGESATMLVVCHAGVVTAVNELPAALSDLTAALMRPIIVGERSIELSEADARRHRDTSGLPAAGEIVETLGVPAERVLPLVEPVLQQWARSLTQWLSFAATNAPMQALSRLVITGPGAAVPGLVRALTGRLPLGVEADDDPARGVQPHPPTNPAPSAGADASRAVLSPAQWAGLRPAVHAAECAFNLPSLLPRELRRTRRLASGIRVAGCCGTVLAATFILATAALWRAGGGLSSTLAANEGTMDKTRSRLSELRHTLQRARRAEKLHNDMQIFSLCTPRWSGVLRELARVLPPQVVLRRVQAEQRNGSVELLVTARVFADTAASGFDQVIQAPLRGLQASPFFEAVEVVSADQPTAGVGPNSESGELRMKMRVIFPTTRENAPASSRPSPPPGGGGAG